jgi:Tfp pilus assembly protein PilX
MDRLKLSNDDLDSQIAGAQAFLNGMNRKGAGSASPASASGGGSASWRAREAQATTNLYASGAGDVRETTMPAGVANGSYETGIYSNNPESAEYYRQSDGAYRIELNGMANTPIKGVDSIAPMGELDGILTFNPAGQALRGAGNFAYDAWMTGPRAVIGLGSLAQDAVGYAANAISPSHSALTGQAFAYQPQSALMQSVQQQGLLGTLGTGITGVVRNAPGIGLIGALGAPNRNWGNIGGQVLNTGMAGVGVLGAARGSVKSLPTQLELNSAAGKAFQTRVSNYGNQTLQNFVEEVSIRPNTATGQASFKIRADGLGRNPNTLSIDLLEAKASELAPLTKNQKLGFPLLQQYGGTIVGAKGGVNYPAGTLINQGTTVQVFRPSNLPKGY